MTRLYPYLVTALRDEVDARWAHADETGVELRKPAAETVDGDGDILMAWPAQVRSQSESPYCGGLAPEQVGSSGCRCSWRTVAGCIPGANRWSEEFLA
jgi:hypothetical protein